MDSEENSKNNILNEEEEIEDNEEEEIEENEEKEIEEEENEEEEKEKNEEKEEEEIEEYEKEENEKNKSQNQKKEKNQKKTNGIFISGIPYLTKEEELKDLFSKYGTITEIKLPKYQDSGKNRGYCHIYYDSKKSALKALELNNYTIGNRYLTVEMAKMNKEELNDEIKTKKQNKINQSKVSINCTTAFVKNLPYDISEKEVGDKFRSCGKIKSLRFVYNSKNKKFKGFCFIQFNEHKSLLKALELNGKEFKGRILKVDFDEGKPKKSYKYDNEHLEPKYNREHIVMLNRKRNKTKK
jgi:nucleolin